MELMNKKIRADRGYERGYGQAVISRYGKVIHIKGCKKINVSCVFF